MSTKGIYTALSGSMAQTQKLDTIANNLANVNTPSFKKDQQVFREYLTAAEKLPDIIQVPKIPASTESFYDMQGGDRGYVESAGTFTDFSQGVLKPSGNALDLALDGPGFFEVLTPQGVRLTRNGSFHVDQGGTLVTKEGHPLLTQGAGDPAQRTVRLATQNLTVGPGGEVYDGPALAGKLALSNVSVAEALEKVGNSLYSIKPNYATQTAPAKAVVHQGFIEASNVNVISEMTDMIAATRNFESTKEAIKAFDKMDEKLVNEVPRLG